MSYHSEFESFLQQDPDELTGKKNDSGKSRKKGNGRKRRNSSVHTVRGTKRSKQIIKDVDEKAKNIPRRLNHRIKGSNHTSNVQNKIPQATSNLDDGNQRLSMSATSGGCKIVTNMASCKPCSVVLERLPKKELINSRSMSQITPHLRSRMSDRLSRILKIKKSCDPTPEDHHIARRTASLTGVVEPKSHSTSFNSRKETATSELSLHDQNSLNSILDNENSEEMGADDDFESFFVKMLKSQLAGHCNNTRSATKDNETTTQQLIDCEDESFAGNMVDLKCRSLSELMTKSTSPLDGKTEPQDFLANLSSETSQLRSLRLTRKKKANANEDNEVPQIYPICQRLQTKVFDDTKDDEIMCDSSENKVSQPTWSSAQLTNKMPTNEDCDVSQDYPLCLELQIKAPDDRGEVGMEYVSSKNKALHSRIPCLASKRRLTANDVQLIRTRLTLKKRMNANQDSKLSEKKSPIEKQQTVVTPRIKDDETNSDTSKKITPNLSDLRLSLKKKIVIFEKPEVEQVQSENDESRTEVCNDNTDGESTSKSSQNEVRQVKCHSLSLRKDTTDIEDHGNYKHNLCSETLQPENIQNQKLCEESKKKSPRISPIRMKTSKSDASTSDLHTEIPQNVNLVQSSDNSFNSDSSDEIFESKASQHSHKRITIVSEDQGVSSIKSMKYHQKEKPTSNSEVKDELDTSSSKPKIGTDSKKRDTSTSLRVLNDTNYSEKVSARNSNNSPVTKSLRISLDKVKFVTKPSRPKVKKNRPLDQKREVHATVHSSEIKIPATPNNLDNNHTQKSLKRKITDYFSKIIKNPTPLEYAGQSSTQDSQDKILKRKYGISKEICVSLIDLKLLKLTSTEYHVPKIEKLINQIAKKSHNSNTDMLLKNHNRSFINSSSLVVSNNRIEESNSTIPMSKNPISDSQYLESRIIVSSRSTESNPLYSSLTQSSTPTSPKKLIPPSNIEHTDVLSSNIVDTPQQQEISKKKSPSLSQCKNVSVVLTNYTTGSQAITSVSKSPNNTRNTLRSRRKKTLENFSNSDTDRKKLPTIKVLTIDNDNGLPETSKRQNESDVATSTDTVGCLGTDHLSNESTMKDVISFENQLKPNPSVPTAMKTPTKSGTSPPLQRQSFRHVVFDGGQTDNKADVNENNTVLKEPIPLEATCMITKPPVKMNNDLPDVKKVVPKFPVNGMTILSREVVEKGSWVGLDDIANDVNISGTTNENTVHDVEYSKAEASNRPCDPNENEIVDSSSDVDNKDYKYPAGCENKSPLLEKKSDARTLSRSPQPTTSVNEESSSSRVTSTTTCDTTKPKTNDLQDKLSSSSVTFCKIVSCIGGSADTVSVISTNEASVPSYPSDDSLTESADDLELVIDMDESNSEPVLAEDTCVDASLLNNVSFEKSLQDSKAARKLKCIFCQKLFINRVNLKNHLALHMKDACHICDKPLTKNTAVEHYLKHYGSFEVNVSIPHCAICDKWFSKKSTFEHHCKMKHQSKLQNITQDSSSSTKCTICSRTYRTREDLFMHVLTHTDHELQDAYQVAKARQQTAQIECQDQSSECEKKKTGDTKQIGLKSVGAVDATRKSCQLAPNCGISICACHEDERLEVTGGVIIEVALTCEHCKTFFKSKSCFTKHYQSRSCGWTDPATFKTTMYCNSCVLILNSLQEMHRHIRTHASLRLEKEPSFFCKQCNVFFFGIGPLFYEHWFSHCRDPMFLVDHSSFPNNFKVKIVEPADQKPTLKKEPTESLFIAEHQCKYCKMPFQTKEGLKKHSCPPGKCSNKVNSSTQSAKGPKATSHAKSEASKESEVIFKLICSICNKDFMDKPTFDSHAIEHETIKDLLQVPDQLLNKSLDPESEQFTCSICNIEYGAMMDYKRHLLRHEVIQEKFFCNYCSLMMDSVEEFGHHSSQHTGTLEKPVACKVIFATAKFHCKRCKIWFDDQVALDKHFQTHGNTMGSEPAKNPSVKIASPLKNKSFSNSMHLEECGEQVELQNPLSTHNDMAAGSSKVDSDLIDASEDSTDIELILSESSEDGKNKSEETPIATNTSIRKEESNRQESKKFAFLRVKNLKELLPYACRLCKSEFDTQIKLVSHSCIRENRFAQQRNYSCRICKNRRFDNFNDWSQHVLSHFPLRITPCLDNNWYSVSKLQNGQQIFKCNRCPDWTCVSLNLMQGHFVKMHTDIYKPSFQCRICNTFTTYSQVKIRQHEASHLQPRQPKPSIRITNTLGNHLNFINNARPVIARPVDANYKLQEVQQIVNSNNHQQPVSIPFSTNSVDNSNLNSQHFIAVVSNSQSRNNLPQFQLANNLNNFQRVLQIQPLSNVVNNPPQVLLVNNTHNFQQTNPMLCTTNPGYCILQRGSGSDRNNVEQTVQASSVPRSMYDQTLGRLVGNSNIIQEAFPNSEVSNSVNSQPQLGLVGNLNTVQQQIATSYINNPDNNQPQFRLDSNNSNTMQGLIQTPCIGYRVNNLSHLQPVGASNPLQQTIQTLQFDNSVSNQPQPQIRLDSNNCNILRGSIQTSRNSHPINNPAYLQPGGASNTFQQTTQSSQFNTPVSNQPQLRRDSGDSNTTQGIIQTSRNDHPVNNPLHLQLDSASDASQQTAQFSNPVNDQPQLSTDFNDFTTIQGLIQTSRNNHSINNPTLLQLDHSSNNFQQTTQTSQFNKPVNNQPQLRRVSGDSNTIQGIIKTSRNIRPVNNQSHLQLDDTLNTFQSTSQTSHANHLVNIQPKLQLTSSSSTLHQTIQTPSRSVDNLISIETKKNLIEQKIRNQFTNESSSNNMTNKMHTLQAQSPSLVYTCRICKNFECLTKQQLKEHESRHQQLKSGDSPKRFYRCKICTNVFSPSEELLRIHMETHHKNQYKRNNALQGQPESSVNHFICKYCTLTFSTASQLIQHATDCRKHANSEQQQNMRRTQLVYPFTCKLCFIGFFNEDHLRAHIKQIHPEAKGLHESRTLFKCGICGLLLLSQGTLNYHMRSHNVNLC